MAENFSNLKEEGVEAENDFIKMKLMLEKGAQFGTIGEEEMSPEIENAFLKNVVEYEKQFEQGKRIKVFDKIGRPAQFKPVAEIPETEIDLAWKNLSGYLFEHRISLSVWSPNISNKEMYRFAVEEFFDYEMEDIDLPGMMHGFIYDEFHPDFPYENTQAAVKDCLPAILSKESFEWAPHFRGTDLRLNELYPLTLEEFQTVVNRFKNVYDDLNLKEITNVHCAINDNDCQVSGDYLLAVNTGIENRELTGKWEVVLKFMQDYGFWYITEVSIGNIDFKA